MSPLCTETRNKVREALLLLGFARIIVGSINTVILRVGDICRNYTELTFQFCNFLLCTPCGLCLYIIAIYVFQLLLLITVSVRIPEDTLATYDPEVYSQSFVRMGKKIIYITV